MIRATSKRTAPAMAALPSRPTTTVWTAASSEPKRWLMTPVARNSWNVSAGMRNMSSRNGTAALRLPKKVSQPVMANAGYDVNGIVTLANQPANSTKLSDSSLPVWGKLNDAGTMMSGRVAACSSWRAGMFRSSNSLHESVSEGNTMNRSPATNAVSMRRVSIARCRRNRSGVRAATSPGSTQAASSTATATYATRYTWMRASCSICSVPAATAATANMPYGVSRTMNFVDRPTVSIATDSTSSSTSLRGTQISATPTTIENRTTAGTMLFASELNGLDGM